MTTSASAARPSDVPVCTIAPAAGWVPIRLAEIWEFRELLFFLVWREVKVRYKQTALGVAWAILQPLLAMVVFSIFFGRLGHIPSDGLPYPVFAFSALVPWQLFAFALTESTNSVVANQRLVTKVYFPRLIMPMAAIGVGLVDFCLSLGVLAALMAYYGVAPSAAVWTLPAWTALALTTALAVGVWLSALNVRYRDIRYTLPFLTQIWLFATPVAYPTSIVPEAWRAVYALNPMVGVVDGFRWALLGSAPAPPVTVGVSCLAVGVLLTGGLFYFRRTERTFADVI
ncbi:MAG TPA: ABC transporter permease [Vicinamibacterales bacterium]|nr:ABC transporter permease [Vicinamibacterales bacterium]